MRALLVLLTGMGLGFAAWSCGPTHCGYNGGDEACVLRDPAAPFCDLCSSDNDGCGASPTLDAACVLAGDSNGAGSAPPSSLDPSTTYGPEPTTTTPGPETSLDTTTTNTTATTATTASTSESSETGESSDSGDSTTTMTMSDDTTSGESSTTSDDTTSGESSTTSDDTTGPQPPMCGNDVVEAAEMCDGADLAGKQCTDFAGKGGGTLACSAACAFDIAGCCLADGQACGTNAECCNSSCKFDLGAFKNICK